MSLATITAGRLHFTMLSGEDVDGIEQAVNGMLHECMAPDAVILKMETNVTPSGHVVVSIWWSE